MPYPVAACRSKGMGPSSPLLVGLSEFYKFSETSGNAVGVNGNTLTASGSPGSVTGGRSFVAASSQCFSQNDAAYQTGTEFTIALRAWANDVSSFTGIICKYDGGSWNRSYQIYAQSNAWTFNVADQTPQSKTASTTDGATANAYHDIVCTISNRDIAIYVDNGNNPGTATLDLDPIDSTARLLISAVNSDGPSAWYSSRILSLGFWNRAFTAADRAAFAGGWEP